MFSDNMPGFTPPTEQEKFEYFNNQIKKKDKKIEQLEAENKRLKDVLNAAYKGFRDDNPDLSFEVIDDYFS
jgi:hypothetical protein